MERLTVAALVLGRGLLWKGRSSLQIMRSLRFWRHGRYEGNGTHGASVCVFRKGEQENALREFPGMNCKK